MKKGINDVKENKQYFAVVTKKGIIKLKMCDILYFEKELRRIHVHTLQNVYSFYGSFKYLETMIDERFCRCHYSFIVNLNKIDKMERHLLYLENGETLTVSQRLYPYTKKRFQAFLR
ncbi:MAG: LytR/AlgR family response regulator transcription factor [Anaerovoracaceae bacterium]